MRCISCGCQVAADSAFCSNCGKSVKNTGTDESFIRKTAKRNPSKWLVEIIGVLLVLFVAVAAFTVLGGHDLSGSYYKDYSIFFYVDSVSFNSNGTFTMQTVNGSFYGKYSKKKGSYYLYPESGISNSSNPVSTVEENHMASEYYFIAKPIADNTLEITMLGRGDYEYYLPWSGQTAIFYNVSTEGANIQEEELNKEMEKHDSNNTVSDEPTKSTSMMDFYQEELEKEPENDIGRPPEEDIVDW